MKQIKSVIIVLAIFCIHQSCTTEPASPEDNCTVSYKNDLVPLISTSCVGYCHATENHYSNYVNIKEVVDSGLLWDKLIETKEMPLYPQSITEAERELFACWIEAGGPNN